jgi:hypothetical protein
MMEKYPSKKLMVTVGAGLVLAAILGVWSGLYEYDYQKKPEKSLHAIVIGCSWNYGTH